jgi:hypothetical protein
MKDAHAPRTDHHEPHRREEDHDQALDERTEPRIETRRDEPRESGGGAIPAR